jgi:hypothetical protein
MTEVPCIIRTDLTESQKKAARIADNKIGELAELDLDNLKFEMEELKNIEFNVELTGFDDFSMLNVFGDKEEKERIGSKELDPSDFSTFDNKCPRCSFEFNNEKE